VKKRYLVLLGALAVCVAFAFAQNGFLSGAYFVNPTVLGTVPMCEQFSGGLCVYEPSGLVDNGTILTYKGVQVGLITSGVTQIVAGANSGISLSPSGGTGIVTITGNSVSGSGTYTTATSDAITVTGATSSSHCTFSPTNATAAAATVIGYISSVSANTVTITHVATSASTGTVNVLCTLN
jgi:hypothetical protein